MKPELIYNIFYKNQDLKDLIHDFDSYEPDQILKEIIKRLKVYNDLPTTDNEQYTKKLKEIEDLRKQNAEQLEEHRSQIDEQYTKKLKEIEDLRKQNAEQLEEHRSQMEEQGKQYREQMDKHKQEEGVKNDQERARSDTKLEEEREKREKERKEYEKRMEELETSVRAKKDELMANQSDEIMKKAVEIAHGVGKADQKSQHILEKLEEELAKSRGVIAEKDEELVKARQKELRSVNSQQRGEDFEAWTRIELNKLPSLLREVEVTSHKPHSGDFIAAIRTPYELPKNVLIDVKDYSGGLPPKEVQKLLDDLNVRPECCAAVLISKGGINNEEYSVSVKYDPRTNKPYVLLSNVKDEVGMALVDKVFKEIGSGDISMKVEDQSNDKNELCEKYFSSRLKEIDSEITELKKMQKNNDKKIILLEEEKKNIVENLIEDNILVDPDSNRFNQLMAMKESDLMKITHPNPGKQGLCNKKAIKQVRIKAIIAHENSQSSV